MGEERHLLAAIYAAPDDDGPRAVYSDWLSERGNPRGEFIASQLAKRGGRRELSLQKKHGEAWAGPLARLFAQGSLVFTRGFLSGGTLRRDVAELPSEGPEWALIESLQATSTTAAHRFPRLKDLRVDELGSLDELLTHPLPASLERFTVVDNVSCQLPALLEAATRAKLTVSVIGVASTASHEYDELHRDDAGAYTRLHSRALIPEAFVHMLRSLPKVTELVLATGRVWSLEEIALVEAAVAELGIAKRKLPWPPGGPVVLEPHIELQLHGAPPVEQILAAVMAPPLSFTFDGIAIDRQHEALVGAPAPRIRKALAKKNVQSVAVYRSRTPASMKVTFTRHGFTIAFRRVIGAEVVPWLLRLLDDIEIDLFGDDPSTPPPVEVRAALAIALEPR